MNQVVTEPEFLEWKQEGVTKAFFTSLKKAREVWKEELIRGEYSNEEFAKGKAQAYLDLVSLTYEDMMEIMNAKY